MRKQEARTIMWSTVAGLGTALVVTVITNLMIRRAGLTWHGKVFTDEAFNWKDSGILLLGAASYAVAMACTAYLMRKRRQRR